MSQQFPILEFQHALADSQWLESGELQARQNVDLSALVEHAWRSVPGQRDRLIAAGFTPGIPITESQFQRIAPMTRAHLQTGGESWLSTDVPVDHGQVIEVHTSGSTGRPVTVLGTVRDAALGKAFQLRTALWHDIDFDLKMAVIRGRPKGKATYPEGIKLDRWGDEVTYPFPTGPRVELSIHEDLERQADWLQRSRPEYLVTYPTNLRHLAHHCLRAGITIPSLRKVLTTSEILTDEDREVCQSAWRAPVVDVYSTMEIGTVAIQCPEHNHLHVQSERVRMEVLRDDGSPSDPGESGRVVLTLLQNFAQPLIRYDIGDLAEVGNACPCGRGLPVVRRILGRVRNMMVLPDGKLVRPKLSVHKLGDVLPIQQIQMVQTDIDSLDVKLVAHGRPALEQEEEMRRIVQSTIPVKMQISFSFHENIPRSESGKYEDFLSMVTRP